MIDLIPDEDQQALLDSFQDLLAAESPVGSGKAPDLWAQIVPLGWLGLARPEAVGGAGLGAVELMLLLRECGRYLASPALMATLVAIDLLDEAGQGDLAARLADGHDRVAFALERDDRSVYLVDGDGADLALRVDDGGLALHRIADGRTPLVSIHERTTLHAAELSDLLATSEKSASFRLMLAAQFAGVAEAVRDVAVEQAKLRQQFGQPIGAFQAIKHQCADLAVRAEAAGAQTSYAALMMANDPAKATVELAAAVRIARQAAVSSAQDNIQIHGAMGTTDECHAHLYLKRANLLSMLDGASSWQAEALLAV